MNTNHVQDLAIETQTFSIDPSHSRLGFLVRHMGFSKVRGSFEAFDGTVNFNPGDLYSLSASARINAETISTNEPKRDEHLRSADFFNVETYPTISFETSDVRVITDRQFILVGEFSMHGVTKTVELTGEYLGESKDPWGGTRIGFEATTTINRKDFGLNWNVALEAGGFLVGEDVDIVLEIQAVRQ
jgi:polyisoprenoid-binding protein YceI